MKPLYKNGLFVVITAALGICYGVALTKYHLFPYNLLSSVKSAVASDAGSPTRNKIYQNRVDLLNSFYSHHEVVMFGDSFMEYGNWDDILNKDVANLGVAGDDTAGMLKRMDQVIRVKPKVVFMVVGINDVDKRVPVKRIFENILFMAKKFNAQGIAVFVNSAVLSGESKKERNDKLMQLNKLLDGAQKDGGYKFIDLNQELAPSGVMLHKYSSDDTHINAEGYSKWKSELLKNYEF